MTKPFTPTTSVAVDPPLSTARQVAALCYRVKTGGGIEVLLITSRGTGRWIIPKGWPIDGLTSAEAAMQEAWEEAGVTEDAVLEGPAGQYDYLKREDDGTDLPVEVEVFRTRVTTLADDFPEAEERTRKWVNPEAAARMVDEPRLKAILRKFAIPG